MQNKGERDGRVVASLALLCPAQVGALNIKIERTFSRRARYLEKHIIPGHGSMVNQFDRQIITPSGVKAFAVHQPGYDTGQLMGKLPSGKVKDSGFLAVGQEQRRVGRFVVLVFMSKAMERKHDVDRVCASRVVPFRGSNIRNGLRVKMAQIVLLASVAKPGPAQSSPSEIFMDVSG